MQISVCTDIVFSGVSTSDAIKAVKSCGIHAVEFWSWWDKDIDAIDRARREAGVEIAAFCTKSNGLTDASRHDEYKAALAETIVVAKKLGCKRIISQVGNDTGRPASEQTQNIIEGLRHCAPLLEDASVTLVIEPLNTRVDHTGYFLWSSDEGAAIVDAVDSPCVKLLFDLYHQQIMEGDIIRRSVSMLDRIGHFHAAGTPGRHELAIGEINYEAVFDALHENGYNGYVGFEYMPLNRVEDGLETWAVKDCFK